MRAYNLLPVLASVLLTSFAVHAKDAGAWNTWVSASHAKCPTSHIDWISDGGYLDFLGDFTGTLSKPEQTRIVTVADAARLCAKETVGFYCEMGANLEAFNKLGLMQKFVEFGCQHYRCEDNADCKRL